jgi:hypothetical protein
MQQNLEDAIFESQFLDKKDRIGLLDLKDQLAKIKSVKDKKKYLNAVLLYNKCLASLQMRHGYTEEVFNNKNKIFQQIMKERLEQNILR